MKEKIFYTDGACSGNPGPGGYGVVGLNENNVFYQFSDFSENTTNNREELKAILHVLKLAAEDTENLYTVYSDSAYAVNSINSWMDGWAKKGWINTKKQIVENVDLMKEIYYIKTNLFNFKLIKIKGHSGELGNEYADALATDNSEKWSKLCKEYNLIIDF